MSQYDISVAACRERQQRLLAVMQEKRMDAVILTQNAHIQYFIGPRYSWTFTPAAAIAADGRVTLVAPNSPPPVAAADELLAYEAQWHCTMRNDQRQAASKVLIDSLLGKLGKRIGVEFSSFSKHLESLASETIDVEPEIHRLRRRKDADELALIQKAIDATGAMYARARQVIQPGVSELEVFNQLQSAAVEECGEMLTGTGNDYQTGSPGGPPRNVRAEAGQLYILDLGPAFRGYFADNARTIAVSEPTAEQQQAWEFIMQVFAIVEENVKPGVHCKEIFQQAQAILDEAPLGEFNHHLGHGIGLFPHEAPHLNPHWDDVFEIGDVFTAEPGLYAPRLAAGMRIENDYRVTETGVENLTPFPLELKV